MSEWQPIETVPKNGIDVLTYNQRGGICIAYQSGAEAVWCSSYSDEVIINPTHWMPLPEPPK